MYSSLLRITLAAFAIELCAAQTPPSFTPATSKSLTVTYGASAISPAGVTVPIPEVASPPTLALSPSTHAGSYVIVMMDLSVEPNNIPTETNTTLIHWILPGLSFPNATTTALTSRSDVIAPYFPPGPPAGQTHTYALFLYDEPPNFTVPADYIPIFKNLSASVENRVGFNLAKFVEQTGLGNPRAANWFLVSNTNASATGSSSSSGMITTTSSTGGAMASSTGGATTSSAGGVMASSSSSSGSAMIKIETLLVMALGAAAIWFNI